MSFTFTPARTPFPEWHGPYSPARGDDAGFRMRNGRLVTLVDTDDGRETWVVRQSRGARALQQLVQRHWRGGRVLLLPNGLVVKPGPDGDGQRWVVGRIAGPVKLDRPDGTIFNLAAPGRVAPGRPWHGPKTTGLECAIDARTGALRASRRIPTRTGFLETAFDVWGPDVALARGFRAGRPGDSGGRVRITANGHVITNRKRRGAWECIYVGNIDGDRWPHVNEWAQTVVRGRARSLSIEQILDAIEDLEELVEIVADEEDAEDEDDTYDKDEDEDEDEDEDDEDEDEDDDDDTEDEDHEFEVEIQDDEDEDEQDDEDDDDEDDERR